MELWLSMFSVRLTKVPVTVAFIGILTRAWSKPERLLPSSEYVELSDI